MMTEQTYTFDDPMPRRHARLANLRRALLRLQDLLDDERLAYDG